MIDVVTRFYDEPIAYSQDEDASHVERAGWPGTAVAELGNDDLWIRRVVDEDVLRPEGHSLCLCGSLAEVPTEFCARCERRAAMRHWVTHVSRVGIERGERIHLRCVSTEQSGHTIDQPVEYLLRTSGIVMHM